MSRIMWKDDGCKFGKMKDITMMVEEMRVGYRRIGGWKRNIIGICV